MCTTIISLSKIAHQVWHNHSFSQKKKTTERAGGVGDEGRREGGGLDKI